MDKSGLKFEQIIDGMTTYTADKIEAVLKIVGFTEIVTDHHCEKPWITVMAKK